MGIGRPCAGAAGVVGFGGEVWGGWGCMNARALRVDLEAFSLPHDHVSRGTHLSLRATTSCAPSMSKNMYQIMIVYDRVISTGYE